MPGNNTPIYRTWGSYCFDTGSRPTVVKSLDTGFFVDHNVEFLCILLHICHLCSIRQLAKPHSIF